VNVAIEANQPKYLQEGITMTISTRAAGLRRGFILGLALIWTATVALGQASVQAEKKPAPYPLSFCPITKQKLGAMGDPVVKVYEGREVRFCCGGCPTKFEKNLTENLKQLDAAVVMDQKPVYPLETCAVSGDKLGSMGEPVDLVYEGRLVRLCCNMHLKDFQAAPAKYIAKLDAAAIARQKTKYQLQNCVVSGEKLDGSMGKSIDYVYAGRLVRLCCKGCIKKFEKNPVKYLAKLGGTAKTATHEGHTMMQGMHM
jgi:YHS domain-containing protein